MYWILGNENIDLSILGITIPRLPVSSTVWQGDSSPMKLSYLTDRFVKRGKMDGHCPNPLSLAGLDQWLNTLLSCLLMRQGWSGIGVVHRVQDFYMLEFSLLLLHVGGGSSYNQKKKKFPYSNHVKPACSQVFSLKIQGNRFPSYWSFRGLINAAFCTLNTAKWELIHLTDTCSINYKIC